MEQQVRTQKIFLANLFSFDAISTKNTKKSLLQVTLF